MGKTTNYQLPYPESSDRVKLGAITMKALAQAVDTVLTDQNKTTVYDLKLPQSAKQTGTFRACLSGKVVTIIMWGLKIDPDQPVGNAQILVPSTFLPKTPMIFRVFPHSGATDFGDARLLIQSNSWRFILTPEAKKSEIYFTCTFVLD